MFVFPTPVGVFPPHHKNIFFIYSLPHACGGVSIDLGGDLSNTVSSPRLWGCFRRSPSASGMASVFPTPVGVFPRSPSRHRIR